MIRNLCRLMALLGIALVACKKHPELQLRTDLAPLQRRLHLPGHVTSVRWVAVSPVKDSGWVPPKIEFYDVYAYLELSPEEWAAFQGVAGPPGTSVSFEIPREAAAVLRLSTGSAFHAEGPSFNPPAVSAGPKGDVIHCLRMKDALVIHFRAS